MGTVGFFIFCDIKKIMTSFGFLFSDRQPYSKIVMNRVEIRLKIKDIK
jgi:hypothetical protein